MDQLKKMGWLKKYGAVLAVVLLGLVLLLLPDAPGEQSPAQPQPEETKEDMEDRLERILSQLEGAGKVAVLLTEQSGEQIVYQSDGEGEDTVLITDGNRNQQGLIRTRQPPVYRGAVVVCGGADSAAVRLAIVEAVSNATGLGTDKITVLKME